MTQIEQDLEDITYRLAQEICDYVDEQALNELLEWWDQEWHKKCINKYEAAKKAVIDDI